VPLLPTLRRWRYLIGKTPLPPSFGVLPIRPRSTSRLMRYAAAYKADSEPLDLFIRRKEGRHQRMRRAVLSAKG
jgi:hypothetical protein